MRTKVTLVLLFLNVVLFYYISNFEGPGIDSRLGKSVYGSEVASIDSFARKDSTGATLLLEKRQGDNWWITKPYEWPANRNAVAGILSELQHLNHEASWAVADLLKNGQTLAERGLTDSALTFTFTSGGKSYETKVGDTSSVGNKLYLLSPDGTRIHVVGRSLLDTIGLSLDRLRSPSIFSIPVFEVRSLGIQTNTKVRLRRDGARWTLETPISARANTNAVETTINALNGLQTFKFLETREADPAVTGLATPEIRVTLEGNKRSETLLIGLPVAETNPAATRAESGPSPITRPRIFYAQIEGKPTVFTMALTADLLPAAQQKDLLSILRNAQELLRDKRVLDFDAHSVTAITLVAPGQPDLNLHRLEAAPGTEAWQLINRSSVGGQAPQTAAADTDLVNDLLQKLENVRAEKFLDAPSDADVENYGFKRPEREITLTLSTGSGPHGSDPSSLTMEIGQKPEERGVAYARLANATFVYQVDPSILEFTPVDTRQFRQRLIRDLPEGARITGLNLTEIGSSSAAYSRQLHEGETWEAALASEPEARHKALVSLLNQLRTLRAQRFITESFSPDHVELNGTAQPWKYRLEATLALTGGNGATQSSSTVLLLTDRIGGTTELAGSAEFNVTFALKQEMLDALFALTYAEKHDPGPPKPETPAGS